MEIFDLREFDGHELVFFGHDAPSGLRAIIAIHSSALGPAAGRLPHVALRARPRTR